MVCKLPSFPPIAAKVLQLLSREDTSVSDVVKLIQSDPAFSVELLRLANSPLYAVRSEITSLSHAVAIVGLERTKSLTMTVAMRSYLKKSLRSSVVKQCWRHSLACGVLGQEFWRFAHVAPDHAYTAGIVHDVGRLGLLSAYPEKYGPILEAAYDRSSDILETEKKALEMDHCLAGFWLTRTWGFPEELCNIAAQHHTPAEEGDYSLLWLVRFACLLADTLGFPAAECRQPLTLEELRALMPPSVRERYEFDVDGLAKKINAQIDSLRLP